MRTIRISIILVILFFLAPASVVQAGALLQEAGNGNVVYLPIISNQRTEVTSLGPFGGRAVALAIDPTNPQIVYAGSWGAGVFKSIDGGAKWLHSSQGLGNSRIYYLAIDNTAPQTLYAGTYGSGVYKTTDGGQTWFRSSNGIEDLAIVYTIAIDPTNSQILYVGTRSGRPEITNRPWYGKIYRSNDGGANWSVLTDTENFGGPSVMDWVYSIAVNPNNPAVLVAAGHETGPKRSPDGGLTWQPSLNGIVDCSFPDPNQRGCHSRSMVYAPNIQNKIYLGYGNGYGVYISTDDGIHWSHYTSGLNGLDNFRLAVDPNTPTTLYSASMTEQAVTVGIMKSTNSGVSWAVTGLQGESTFEVKVDPTYRPTGSHLFAGTFTLGVWKSTNAGTNWNAVNNGFSTKSITATVVHPSLSYILYTSMNGNGVARSLDGGTTWADYSGGLGDKGIHAMASPGGAYANYLYALTDYSGVYRIDINSGVWQAKGFVANASISNQPAFEPSHPFAPQEDPAIEAGVTNRQIDSTVQAQVPLLSLAFNPPPNPNIIMYVGTSGKGVYKSINAGGSWTASGLSPLSVWSLAIDPTNTNIVYAATSEPGVIKMSTGGGGTWSNTVLPLGNLTAYTVYFSPSDSTVLYAGTSGGIYKRIGAGSWTYLGLSEISVTAILEKPGAANMIFAGTTDGLRISYDGGINWQPGPTELSGLTVQTLTVDWNDSHFVYVGTPGGNVRVRFP